MADTISNVIAATGVVVTSIFSWLVYKATLISAKVAEETYNLSKRLAEEEKKRVEEHRKIMRLQLIRIIIEETSKVEFALAGLDAMSIYNKLKDAPTKLDVSIQDLAEYFTSDEVNMINRPWKSYDVYRNNYLRNTYSGDEIKVLVEKASPVLDDINYLKNGLKV